MENERIQLVPPSLKYTESMLTVINESQAELLTVNELEHKQLTLFATPHNFSHLYS